jgi:deoxyribodipyrimidine photo-lyase
MAIQLFWFRRDLRLHDNHALYEALQSGLPVLPLFIFDTSILDQLEPHDARITFIHQSLEQLNHQLLPFNTSISVFHGNPIQVFTQLLAQHTIDTVYTNTDYEPSATQRDTAVAHLLAQHNTKFKSYKDQVIFEKNDILKPDGTPYVVFTPYCKKWLEKNESEGIPYFPSEKHLDQLYAHPYPFPTLETIGFIPSPITIPPFDISESLLQHYESTRNFPAIAGTSMLSTQLRFGTISIRSIISKALALQATVFLKELVWREFFMQILWHYPHTTQRSFKPKYDRIEWVNNEEQFQRWCDGKTGYPMVDAGMRCLNATGLMHNRVRMIVASFLCKHLLIDWRWGEAYFASQLLDYEQASNVGNWQWASGSGVDAAPYFRIFNPEEQLKKFDKEAEYIKRWIPEWGTQKYPEPIVDHKEARDRSLRVYKNAVG